MKALFGTAAIAVILFVGYFFFAEMRDGRRAAVAAERAEWSRRCEQASLDARALSSGLPVESGHGQNMIINELTQCLNRLEGKPI